MVLSPDELEKKVEDAVKAHVDNLARNIDYFLRDQRMVLGNSEPYAYHVGKCGDTEAIKSEILQRTIKAYEGVGWSVSYNAANSELTFKSRKK